MVTSGAFFLAPSPQSTVASATLGSSNIDYTVCWRCWCCSCFLYILLGVSIPSSPTGRSQRSKAACRHHLPFLLMKTEKICHTDKFSVSLSQQGELVTTKYKHQLRNAPPHSEPRVTLRFTSFVLTLTSSNFPASPPSFASKSLSVSFWHTNFVHLSFCLHICLSVCSSLLPSYFPTLSPSITTFNPYPSVFTPSLYFPTICHSSPSCLCQSELPGIHPKDVLLSELDSTPPADLLTLTHLKG